MTNKSESKVSKATVTKYTKALDALLSSLAHAHEVEQAGKAKAAQLRSEAVNFTIDAGRAAGKDTGDIKDDVSAVFEKAVELGHLVEKSAKDYMRGVAFALERSVMWNASLHGNPARVKALQDAGKSIPKSLQAAAEKEAAKAEAAREAKHGKTHVASVETVIKALAKALADARTLGKGELAADILDVIHSVKPDFVEPKAE
jgi:hypothetical protein